MAVILIAKTTMHFNNLTEVPFAQITQTFNEAFADYAIPMHFTESQFKEKLLRDGTSLEHSVGAFAGNKLIGLILQGVGHWRDKLTAYNGGTGVIPAYRGQKLTRQMYAFSLPKLQLAGVENCLLEVLQTNLPADNTYEAIGFKTVRQVVSFKGILNINKLIANYPGKTYNFKQVKQIDWKQVQSFWDYEPSWQYSAAALERIQHLTNLIEITVDNLLIGYGAITKNTNRIAQFAIAPAYRRKGLGSYLFKELVQGHTGEIAVINVDTRSTGTLTFLENMGLSPFISQKEKLLIL